jgi:hypothetical protein
MSHSPFLLVELHQIYARSCRARRRGRCAGGGAIAWLALCGPTKPAAAGATMQGNEATLARLHTALDYESPYETNLKEYEQRLAEIDKELLGKTEEVEELVDAETEELSSSKTFPVDQKITDNNKIVCVEAIEDKFLAQVAVDDAPGEPLGVAAIQAPRFKRKQTADRGR